MNSTPPPTTAAAAAIEAAFRIEFPRLVGGLARRVGDLGLAEDLAQDAFVEALAVWLRDGTPRNPGAWLMACAKRRGIDRFRRDHKLAANYRLLAAIAGPTAEFALPDDDLIDDDRLRLIFVSCHPALPVPSRIALTLRMVGGLTTAEIARAFLQPEPTVAQRIVRAKRTIAEAGVPFEVPAAAERPERLGSVMHVVYLIFNEGYTASTGVDWTRPDLCHEALRLARLLSAVSPGDADVHGLAALLELQASRLNARHGAAGEPVLLADQDRRRWDRLHIRRGLDALERARLLSPSPGSYTLQAEIAACHASASSVEATDWPRIVGLYGQLADRTGSHVVQLNRAVAISMASGPSNALELVEDLAAPLDGYYLFHSVRGDLLDKLGRRSDAARAFRRAADLAANDVERRMMTDRAEASSEDKV